MTSLSVRFVKRFPAGPVIDVDFTIPLERFAITVLIGPSGGGKSTTLRVLAGLERPDTGVIRYGDDVWFDGRRCRSPQARSAGMLFQDYALFPHLSIAGNIRYPLAGLPRAAASEKVAAMLARFDLEAIADRYPQQVSGGQQQRAALARTLVAGPRLLLLDEPLAALDPVLREQLRFELRKLLAEFAIPAILVTHDRTEAIALGDQILVMHGGRVAQQGSVEEVFARPATPEVARIVGTETIVPGEVVSMQEGLAIVAVGQVELAASSGDLLPGLSADTSNAAARAPRSNPSQVHVCIQAGDVILLRDSPAATSARNRLAGRVVALSRDGRAMRIELDVGFPLIASITQQSATELGLAPGVAITALIKAPAIHLVPRV